MVSIETLVGLPLFREATTPLLSALARRGAEVHFATNAVLFLAGDPPRGWFVVLEGRVRVVRGSASRQHVVHTEGAGGTLGEVPLFTQRPHPATAIAAEPTRCVLWDRAGLELAIAEVPAIAFLLAGRLAQRVERLVERLHERSATSVQSRLIEYLLRRPSPRGNDGISLAMTQQALAEDLGTVREVIVRELRSLSRRGWIQPAGGGRYRILDRAAMHEAVRQLRGESSG